MKRFCFESLEERTLLAVSAGIEAAFAALADRLAAGDLAGGFAAAHALKGVAANLALTPLLTPVSEITEHLRAGEEMDYAPLLAQIEQQKQQLAALAQA